MNHSLALAVSVGLNLKRPIDPHSAIRNLIAASVLSIRIPQSQIRNGQAPFASTACAGEEGEQYAIRRV